MHKNLWEASSFKNVILAISQCNNNFRSTQPKYCYARELILSETSNAVAVPQTTVRRINSKEAQKT